VSIGYRAGERTVFLVKLIMGSLLCSMPFGVGCGERIIITTNTRGPPFGKVILQCDFLRRIKKKEK